MTRVVLRKRTIEKGTVTFSVESRVLREFGERLVKEPDVAIVELIKNAHDADAVECRITRSPADLTVFDNGHGMTLEEFRSGWMRIGTSSKANKATSRRYRRNITGEKGIGRFAVRFLGRSLSLRTVADDKARGQRTVLVAEFHWPRFDKNEDLGKISVPYVLSTAEAGDKPGTTLTIGDLRPTVDDINWRSILSSSLSLVSPYRSLLAGAGAPQSPSKKGRRDPGFHLTIGDADANSQDLDLADLVLGHAVLRAHGSLRGNRLNLVVSDGRGGRRRLTINDRLKNMIGRAYFDIRYFPDRKGTFTNMPVGGPLAREWVRENHGVAVFDRGFRVLPYGTKGDDWLELGADVSIRHREPKSSLAEKHFPMTEKEAVSTKLNFMLRLPHPRQLVGVVQVEGRRSTDEDARGRGLIPAADREGFVDNPAFRELFDVIRGAAEAIAAVDRELTLRQEEREAAAQIRVLKADTRAAIREIKANKHIRRADKDRLIEQLVATTQQAETASETARDLQQRLEVMSLLGVVAGFMTHEFGVAVHELEKAKTLLAGLAKKHPELRAFADSIGGHMKSLEEFVTYSQAYIRGTITPPARPYGARPRVDQIIRIFGKYADERSIRVVNDIPSDLDAPLVPVSLYTGICLNLYTNALKAVTAKAGDGPRDIVFSAQASNDGHRLTVADTGIGIPTALTSRVFDPLFTTTSGNRDPLGSGMGLGLTLVKRAVESYGGSVELIDPPDGFATAVSVHFPVQ